MLKVGVIGLGVMGQHHARLYAELQNSLGRSNSPNSELITHNPKLSEISLVGVADASPARAKEIGDKYHVPFYTDYHDLLGKVDAVSIAVPTTLHHSVSSEFLAAGIHCLVEKPIASSLTEAESMVQLAEQNNVCLAVGHIEHFNPAVIALKKIVSEGTLGEILIISTRRVGPYAPRIRDVGIVIDSATHDIGVIKYLTEKDPVSVYSRVGSLVHPKEDHAIIALDFGGTMATVEVNWFTPHKVRTLVATGSAGMAYLDYIDQKVTLHNSHVVNVPILKIEPLRLEIEDFLNSIMYGSKPKVDGTEGLEILKIALSSSVNNYVAVAV